MQYPYLIFIEVITVIVTLFIGIIIFCFLVRLFNKAAKFSMILKGIVLYELSSFILYLIYLPPLLCRIFNNYELKLKILDLLLFSNILFFTFYFIMKKMVLISWKKSLIIFFIVIFVLFPTLSFCRTTILLKITTLPVFSREISQMVNQLEEHGFAYQPLPLKIIGKIESSMLSWPSEYIREIVFELFLL